MSDAASQAPQEQQFTIDELSAHSSVPSRTIRFYQSKGVLSAPAIKGRVAYYGEHHLSRLELIARLQDRGLRMDAIREVVTRMDKNELDVGEWLGVSDELGAPWADDASRTLTDAELRELAGTARPGLIADLVRLGLATRTGDRYLVESPSLLSVAMRLDKVGVDLEVAVQGHDILRRHLAKATKDLASHFLDAAAKSGDIADVPQAIDAFRGAGLDAVRLVFAQEMEKVLRDTVTSGRSTKLGKGKKPKR